MLDIEAALSDNPEQYAEPLEQLSQQMVQMLAPQSLHPEDPNNIVLTMQAAFANGLAELERAGYSAQDLSLYNFWYKLQYLEKKPTAPATR